MGAATADGITGAGDGLAVATSTEAEAWAAEAEAEAVAGAATARGRPRTAGMTLSTARTTGAGGTARIAIGVDAIPTAGRPSESSGGAMAAAARSSPDAVRSSTRFV